MKGKSDQPELHPCDTNSPMRKSEVDQTLEIVSNEYCLGEVKANILTKETSGGKEESAKRFCNQNLV